MGKEIVRIEDLSKIYKVKRKEVIAIKNINLMIEEKDIYGIIGLSGAGKSTLIRCINYLETPTSGNVYYKGRALAGLKNKDLRKIRQEIGMIFQGFHLLEQKSVLKNVLFPLEIAKVKKDKAIKKAKDLLEIVGLSDKLEAYPHELSGGQKQRVAIARALANDPSILLCDEATSALDPSTTQSILSLLKKINEEFGITIVMITHEMNVIESICNKVAIIDQSQIQEVGDTSEILVSSKTKIAKNFLFPNKNILVESFGSKLLKLEFDKNCLEPIISEMILETKVAINIVEANIKMEGEKIIGTMIIQLPKEETKISKIKHYLDLKKIFYKEEAMK